MSETHCEAPQQGPLQTVVVEPVMGVPVMSDDGHAIVPRSEGARPQAHHLFVLSQHGSHGWPDQLLPVRDALMSDPRVGATPSSPTGAFTTTDVTYWHTDVNTKLKSDAGTIVCGARLLDKLLTRLSQWVVEKKSSDADCTHHFYFSCVAHSFGGVLLREILPDLLRDPLVVVNRIKLVTFASIASPHCGASDLNPAFRLGGWVIGKVWSQTYQDLLLHNDVISRRLLDVEHINGFKQFAHRELYGNLRGDLLVSFETSSLIYNRQEVTAIQADAAERAAAKKRFQSESEYEAEQAASSSTTANPYPHIMPHITLTPSNLGAQGEQRPAIGNWTGSSGGHSAALSPKDIAHRLRAEMEFTVWPMRHHIPAFSHTAAVGKARFGVTMDDVPRHVAMRIMTQFLEAVAATPSA